MTLTSLSLLQRLRRAEPGDADWKRFDDLYRPLVRSWLCRVPGLSSEVDDLTQETLIVIFRELPQFERRRDGAFRAWLRQKYQTDAALQTAWADKHVTLDTAEVPSQAEQSNTTTGGSFRDPRRERNPE